MLIYVCSENSGAPRNKTVSFFKDTVTGKLHRVLHSSKEEPKAEDIVLPEAKIERPLKKLNTAIISAGRSFTNLGKAFEQASVAMEELPVKPSRKVNKKVQS